MDAPPQSYAQHGEDLLVWDYFRHKTDGFFVEVGANHPTELSQTWFLEQRGWKGLLIEPLPACCAKLREVRRASTICETAVGAPDQVGQATLQVAASDAWSRLGQLDAGTTAVRSIQVQVRTLEQLCEEHRVPQIDFLSIDVEGMEIAVLSGFDLAKRKPTLILLEDHLDGIELCLFMWRAGYLLGKRMGCNNFWVHPQAPRLPQDFAEKLKLWNRILFRHSLAKLRTVLGGAR